MEKTSFSLVDYKRTIFQLSGWLRQLRTYSETLELNGAVRAIDNALTRVETNSFEIAVVGEFKRGKSTLINALLGKEILPADIVPTTATLNRITYGLKDQVKICFKDGQEDIIAIDQLNQYITKLTPAAESIAATIQEAIVYYPIPYCQNGVDIIDTPGLSDEATMTATTLAILPKVDAAIFVVMAQSPFSDSERLFLESNLLTASLGRVLFVVTGIDRCNRPEDIEKIIQSVELRIKTHVLKGAEEKFGADSPAYRGYLSRIGQPKVFGVSAYQALQAKRSGNTELLSQSRFPALETALEKFLTEERGIIFLQVPINQIMSVAKAVLDEITAKKTVLTHENSLLRANYESAISSLMAEHQSFQQSQRQQQQSTEAMQQRLYQLLNQLESNFKQVVTQIVETTLLTSQDFQPSHMAERMVALDRTVAEALEIQSRRWAGRIQTELRQGVGQVQGTRQLPSEQMSHLLDQTGLLCVNLGTDIRRLILQRRVAWNLASAATGGVGGWLTHTLRAQEIVPTFKARYKSQVVGIVTQKIAEDRTPQQIYAKIAAVLDVLKSPQTAQADLQNSLSEQRIQVERNETRTELRLQSLKDTQRATENIMNQAQVVLTQLLQVTGVTSST